MAHVKPLPPGYPTVTPYLIVRGAAEAIEFYKRVFGAIERMRLNGPDGKSIAHAELQLGESVLMLADESPALGALSPQSVAGNPISLLIYVENVDEVFGRALAAGAQEIRPVKNQFYGDRSGMLQDPFGHKWSVATHVEDVSSEEMDQRMKAMAAPRS
jgi:PhnB protein